MSMKVRVLAKTNPGLEDLLATELAALSSGATYCVSEGRVLYDTGLDEVVKILKLSKLAHRISIVVFKGKIPKALNGVREAEAIAESIEWENYISAGETFAVKAERVGEGHEYTSIDIASSVGEGIVRRVGEKLGVRVHLKSPNKLVYADVIDDELIISVGVGSCKSMHRRWYRVREHPASLKPTLAYAMLWLSQAIDGEVILDPMCGCGTIPIEAALELEESRIYCNDINEKWIKYARENALLARVYHRIKFTSTDAVELPERHGVYRVQNIICNPPYGIRMGSIREACIALSKLFKLASKTLTEDGRLVLITPMLRTALKYSDRAGLTLYHKRRVKHGDLRAWILCFIKE